MEIEVMKWVNLLLRIFLSIQMKELQVIISRYCKNFGFQNKFRGTVFFLS